jgi:hypothetical protein
MLQCQSAQIRLYSSGASRQLPKIARYSLPFTTWEAYRQPFLSTFKWQSPASWICPAYIVNIQEQSSRIIESLTLANQIGSFDSEYHPYFCLSRLRLYRYFSNILSEYDGHLPSSIRVQDFGQRLLGEVSPGPFLGILGRSAWRISVAV